MRIRVSLGLGIVCLGLAAAVAGCGGSSPPVVPKSFEATVAPNPLSVCSAVVSFTLPGATSALVTATGGEDDLKTPSITVGADGQASITVLGLAAKTKYDLVVEAQVDGTTVKSTPLTFTTSPLPPSLQGVTMQVASHGGNPSATGYYLVEGAGTNVFAVDGKGKVRWYRQFTDFAAETKMQTDGTFTTFVGKTMGYEAVSGEYVRYTPDGQATATYRAASPDTTESGQPVVYTDNHDLLITKDAKGDEHVHMIAYELRPISATDSTLNAWHMVQRLNATTGAVEFEWKSWSRFSSADNTDPIATAPDVDHMNALSLDPSNGNYVVSLRDLDAVIEVDQASGEVLWQVGGKQSTLTVENDPLGTFYGQHDAHLLPNGHLLMLDNGVKHAPVESRAAEYALDMKAGTATLVWEYRHKPAIVTSVLGSAVRLASGNTLVAFALAGTVDEVDPSGKLVWEGQLELGTTPLGAYRVLPLASLYEYAAP